MERTPATIEQVREAQDYFKQGLSEHEAKNYKEAIAVFRKCADINPVDPQRVNELGKKLKQGTYKLLQESVAFMGCAAVHLHGLVGELAPAERELVPVDEELAKVFKGWEREL